ncbi:ABC transporter permease [Neobacillus jeddahensis]|uniref:ABC transporter permease n=1 Tax=Neobacillus jeddahensis TaxID=1461580 RepID=UPI001FCB7676|nr:ABC transporter permease [Neobacillus jeddahensis]
MIIAVVVMPLFIGAAIFFSGHFTNVYKVAFISDHAISFPKSKSIQIDKINERPATSSLAMGKYNAFVEVNKDGEFKVTTLKGESDKKAIQTFFEGGKLPENNKTEQRGIGTNILGFVLMLALMQGVALTTFYPEDRNNSTFKRILTSPVNSRQYLAAQGIFTFICLYVPTFIAIAITKICFGVEIGFGLGNLAVLLVILASLATAFSLFMASIMDRNISLGTSGISIITCILAGCFFNFTGNIKVLDVLCNILPQKAFMILIQAVENGRAFQEFAGQLTYTVTWVFALWLVGSVVTNRRIKKGVY